MDAIVKQQIIKSMGCLQALGFKQILHANDLVYENNYVTISFSFFKSVSDYSLLISIKKFGENKSYFLNEFLDYIGREQVIYVKGENADSYVDRNLQTLKYLIANELSEVVTGKNWIVVPRDYLGYR